MFCDGTALLVCFTCEVAPLAVPATLHLADLAAACSFAGCSCAGCGVALSSQMVAPLAQQERCSLLLIFLMVVWRWGCRCLHLVHCT